VFDDYCVALHEFMHKFEV